MRSNLIAVVLATAFGACAECRADVPLSAKLVTSGLSKPLFLTSAPGDQNDVFVVEQTGSGSLSSSGVVRILDTSTNTIQTDPFLVIPNVSTGSEQGLLGLAFHPSYATNGQFYVNFTDASGNTQVQQWHKPSNQPPVFDHMVLSISQPQSNHNGGWLSFGPDDGYLYIGTGDGGNFDDQGSGHTEPGGNAQDLTSNLLGKLLRIDVNSDSFPSDANRNYAIPSNNPFVGTGNDEEIWNYGLRNPWRPSFDRKTHDLYIADVGQNRTEEVDFQSANSPGGINFGWRAYEGSQPRPGNSDILPANAVSPIYEYDHGGGSRSITGGYVYRGDENLALEGTYFFADYVSRQIWSFKYVNGQVTKFRTLQNPGTGLNFPTDAGSIGNITSFGEDAQGRLYILDSDGDVFRVAPAFPGDVNLDNIVNMDDLFALAQHWGQVGGGLWADGDFTDDGNVNIEDLYALAKHWQDTNTNLSAALTSLNLPVVPEPPWSTVLFVAVISWLRRGTRKSLPRRRDGWRTSRVI